MQNESGQNGRQSRRELSIIYFIDADKTRTLRIPVSRLNIILVALLSTSLWVVASFGIISYLSLENATLSSEIKGLMNNLFDYQARYDDVYENAYPTPIKTITNKKPSVAVKAAAKPVTAVAAKTVEETKPKKVAMRDSGTPLRTLVNGKKIRIQNIKVTRSENKFKYSFSLINDGKSREKGHLWGVAEIEDKNGKKHLISSPGRLKIENIGSVENPTKGHWYAIRRFKQQSFIFNTQDIEGPKITRLVIGIHTIDKKMGRAEIQTGDNQLKPFEN